MGDSVHHGPPTVTGEERRPLDHFYYPTVFGMPFMVLIEGSDAMFLTIFSSPDLCRTHMEQPTVRKVLLANFKTTNYRTVKVDNPHEFLSVIWKQGCRVMLDPQVVSPHHTKWFEPVADDDNRLIYVKPQ